MDWSRLVSGVFMATTRDWQRNREKWIRVLERQTGAGLEVWSERLRKRSFADAPALRAWLSKQRVTGYAQSLLVMERFGYPDFVTATAKQLIDAQYAERQHLRPVYDAIIAAATRCGELVIQARKTVAERLAATIPTTSLITFSSDDHWVVHRFPEQSAAAIRSFIQQPLHPR
jgi:pimeloyl-ACP methyl ester carboxylesterase